MARVTFPEFLTSQTPRVVRERMLNRFPEGWDRSEGSFAYDAVAVVAAELSTWAEWSRLYLLWTFVQTTYGPYLEARADEVGLDRRQAQYSQGILLVRGAVGTFIPSLWTVSTVPSMDDPTPMVFTTTVDATIGADGTVLVDIQAVLPGTLSNVPAGTIRVPSTPVDGLTDITNPDETVGGADVETDDELRERIFAKTREDTGDANVADYERWALDVAGVQSVTVQPNIPTVGYVDIHITEAGSLSPSDALIEAVWDRLDPNHPPLGTPLDTLEQVEAAALAPGNEDWGKGYGLAAIGHRTTVKSPVRLHITVEILGISYEQGYTGPEVFPFLNNAVRAFINGQETGALVRYNDLVAVVVRTPGVADFTSLKMNGDAAGVQADINEKPAASGVIMASSSRPIVYLTASHIGVPPTVPTTVVVTTLHYITALSTLDPDDGTTTINAATTVSADMP